jgi:hypothetical protein
MALIVAAHNLQTIGESTYCSRSEQYRTPIQSPRRSRGFHHD